MRKHTARPERPSTIVPFPERFQTTLRLPDGRAVDAEFEGVGHPPAAPFAGQRVTQWEVPARRTPTLPSAASCGRFRVFRHLRGQ